MKIEKSLDLLIKNLNNEEKSFLISKKVKKEFYTNIIERIIFEIDQAQI